MQEKIENPESNIHRELFEKSLDIEAAAKEQIEIPNDQQKKLRGKFERLFKYITNLEKVEKIGKLLKEILVLIKHLTDNTS